MPAIDIRLTNDEKRILENASKVYGCDMSSMIKKIVLEHLEDEYDLQIVREYEQKRERGEIQTKPIEVVWNELDL